MVVRKAVITVIVTIGTAVIVTAVGYLAMTRIVTVIPMAVIAVTVTAIGAGAPLVVIRRIIAGARVTPEALPGVAARLMRQGTLMKKLLRMREHRDAAKNKARVRDNASFSTLIAALQGALDNNSSGAGSTKMPGAQRKREKMKAATLVEVVEVVDNADEGEDEGEVRNNGTTTLALHVEQRICA
jgi:hypothetical protein